MKLAIKILNAVLVVILTVCIIGLMTTTIASSTVLKEDYIYNMMQKSKYYDNLYEEIKLTFENYVGPSGFDENILDDICSKEDIYKDTETILGNIYEGQGEQVNTEEIKNRITDKINQKIQDEIITERMQASINKFAETVADEYIETISHTEYEEQLNNIYKQVTKLVETSQKVFAIIVAIVLALIIGLNIKKIYYIILNIATALCASGVFYIIIYYIIHSKVKIGQLKIFNNAISLVLQNTITDVLHDIYKVGWMLSIIGIIAIIICQWGRGILAQN